MHKPPTQKKVKLTETAIKKKKKKNKKDKFCGLDQNVVMSITSNKSNTNNNMNDSDIIFVGSEEPQTTPKLKKNKINKLKHKNESVICLDSDDSKTPQKLKKKKKKQSFVTSTPKPVTNSSILSNKKKKKAHGKLAEILKNSSKKNKSSNLLQFLTSL